MEKEKKSLATDSLIFGFCLSVLFIGRSILFFTPITNADALFHIRFGQEFLSGEWSTRNPGHIGQFDSYDWGSTQLVSQMAMGWLESQWGLDAVNSLYILLYGIVISCIYYVLRQGASQFHSIIFLLIPLISFSSWLTYRPVIIQFALLPLIFYIYWKHRDKAVAPIATIFILFGWSLLHGSWLLGVYIIGIFALYNLTWSFKRFLTDVGVVLAAVALVILGPAGWRSIWDAVYLIVNTNSAQVSEWTPASLTSFEGLSLYLALFLSLAIFLVNKPTRLEIFLIIGMLAGFASGGRAQAPMVLLLTIMAAWKYQASKGEFKEEKRKDVMLLPLITVGLVFVSIFIPMNKDTELLPGDINSTLTAMRPGTPLLTTNAYGSTILYTHPELDPYMFGYHDLYTQDEIRTYQKIFYAAPGWQEELADLKIEWALVPKDETLAYNLELYGYKIVEEDSNLVLMKKSY